MFVLRLLAALMVVAVLGTWARPAKALSYAGYVDDLGQETIGGWACVADASFTLPAWIHVYDGPAYLLTAPANSEYRPDAAHLCGGKKWTGFRISTPKLSYGNHTIRIFVSSTKSGGSAVMLPGATTFHYGTPFLGPSPFGVIESSSAGSIAGWACDTNAPANATEIHVYIQYYGAGLPRPLTSGWTTVTRNDVAGVCGSGSKKGFSIPLPTLPGGNHNIIAYAINVGAGNNRILDTHGSVAASITVPYQSSWIPYPDLQYATNCWTGVAGINGIYANGAGCPSPGQYLWALSISRTYNYADPPNPLIPSVPLSPYNGSNARFRYGPVNGNSGFSMKVNTWDAPEQGQILNRCDYNFQALQTVVGEVDLAGLNGLTLETTITTKNDGSFLFNPVNATDGTGCWNAIETGQNPWMHLIATAVFQTKPPLARRVYFLELVPFWQSGTLTGSYPSFAEFPGNNKPHHNNTPAQYTASDPANTGGGIGGQVTPDYALNARIATTDERIRDFIIAPSPMALGETRTFYVDLIPAFRAIFPGVNTDELFCTGAYVGTEQFNKARIGLDIRRMSLIVR